MPIPHEARDRQLGFQLDPDHEHPSRLRSGWPVREHQDSSDRTEGLGTPSSLREDGVPQVSVRSELS
eukprot:gene26776-biopygen5102